MYRASRGRIASVTSKSWLADAGAAIEDTPFVVFVDDAETAVSTSLPVRQIWGRGKEGTRVCEVPDVDLI